MRPLVHCLVSSLHRRLHISSTRVGLRPRAQGHHPGRRHPGGRRAFRPYGGRGPAAGAARTVAPSADCPALSALAATPAPHASDSTAPEQHSLPTRELIMTGTAPAAAVDSRAAPAQHEAQMREQTVLAAAQAPAASDGSKRRHSPTCTCTSRRKRVLGVLTPRQQRCLMMGTLRVRPSWARLLHPSRLARRCRQRTAAAFVRHWSQLRPQQQPWLRKP